MKAVVELELEPFTIPNFVRVKSNVPGSEEMVAFPLSVIDPRGLERLCDQFRTEVFQKAGKSPPPMEAQTRR
jgi:hypothetical protein